jgi:hypothetical protein
MKHLIIAFSLTILTAGAAQAQTSWCNTDNCIQCELERDRNQRQLDEMQRYNQAPPYKSNRHNTSPATNPY